MTDDQHTLEELRRERGQLIHKSEMGDPAAQLRLLHVTRCIRELEAAGRGEMTPTVERQSHV